MKYRIKSTHPDRIIFDKLIDFLHKNNIQIYSGQPIEISIEGFSYKVEDIEGTYLINLLPQETEVNLTFRRYNDQR